MTASAIVSTFVDRVLNARDLTSIIRAAPGPALTVPVRPMSSR
jgi:hypothetical protein